MLRALLLGQPRPLAAALLVGVPLAAAQALPPAALGAAVDAALDRDSAALPGRIGAVLGLGLVAAGAAGVTEYLRTTMWIAAGCGCCAGWAASGGSPTGSRGPASGCAGPGWRPAGSLPGWPVSRC